MVTETQPDRTAKLLFGAARRDILALLYMRPTERFYLREIERATGAGIGPVQRELKQLVAAGLVNTERHAQHVYFQANQASPIFAELRAILEKTSGAVEVLRLSLAQLLADGRIETAFIYGSVAQGRQTAESDVDLFVLGDVSLADLVPSIRLAEDRLRREVNPTVFSRDDLQARSQSAFLKRILAGPKLMIAGNIDVVDGLVG